MRQHASNFSLFQDQDAEHDNATVAENVASKDWNDDNFELVGKKERKGAPKFSTSKAAGILIFRTFNNDPTSLEFLLGKFVGENAWEHFGGKIKSTDTSIEAAAFRELNEETLQMLNDSERKLVQSSLNIERSIYLPDSFQVLFLVHLPNFEPNLETWNAKACKLVEEQEQKKKQKKIELDEFKFFKEFPPNMRDYLCTFIPKEKENIFEMAKEIIKNPTTKTTSTRHRV